MSESKRLIEINNFTDVMMYALDWKRREKNDENPLLTFSEIWQICDAAGPQMKTPIRATIMDRKEFSKRVFEAIEFMQSLSFGWRYPEHGKIVHVGLTQRGKLWLDNVVFTHQDRLNKPAWPYWLGGEA